MTVAARHLTATFAGLTTALSNCARSAPSSVKQDVRVLTKVYGGGFGPSYIVLVGGEYYDVNQRLLDALQQGATPAYLGLEPNQPDRPPEYPADDRACSAADRAFQFKQEQF